MRPAMSHRALAGLRVLITRPEGEGAEEWASALAAAGAIPVRYPTVAIVPAESWQALDQALARLLDYDWLIFTSQSAVAFTLARLPGQRLPADLRARIAAVGARTAAAVERHGGKVALVPGDARQEGLLDALRGLPAGTRVLFPAARGARTLLASELRTRRCLVDVVTVYQTVPRTPLPAPPRFDVATFASPSALQALVEQLGQEVLAGRTVAVIGSTTASEAAAQGLRPVVSRTPDVNGLVLAIAESQPSQGDPDVVP